MKLIIKTEKECAGLAAQQYVSLLAKKPNAVLGLATGSTPEMLYDELTRLYESGKISFKDVVSYNLDEYVGLDGTHDQSYRYFMDKHLFDRVDIKKENTFVPCGLNATDATAAEYDKKVLAAGVDLQLLGIGPNGHIGFNEPGTPWDAITHVVELTPRTREANKRFFASIDDVPTHAVSMGIKTVMQSKEIILMAFGKVKAEAVLGLVKGKITNDCPASILQLHPNCTVYADYEAASLL